MSAPRMHGPLYDYEIRALRKAVAYLLSANRPGQPRLGRLIRHGTAALDRLEAMPPDRSPYRDDA